MLLNANNVVMALPGLDSIDLIVIAMDQLFMANRLITSGLLDEIEDAGLGRLVGGVALVDEVARHGRITTTD